MITQKKYAIDLLKDAGYYDCKSAVTPLETSFKYSHGDSELVSDNFGYISIIRKLLYLTTARPNIGFTFQQL